MNYPIEVDGGDKDSYYRCLMSKEKYSKALEGIIETPHIPTLKYIQEENGKLFLGELRDKLFWKTDTLVEAEKVGDFCYTEEEFYHPIAKKCLEIIFEEFPKFGLTIAST